MITDTNGNFHFQLLKGNISTAVFVDLFIAKKNLEILTLSSEFFSQV